MKVGWRGGRKLDSKKMSDMQQEVDRYISQFKEGYFHPLSMLARMTEEVGELAREVNHRYGEKPKKTDEADRSMEMELGDLLFIIICFANSLHIDLDEAFQLVMDKYNTRDANRWTRIEPEDKTKEDLD
ncbi:MAG: nucleotide pyrophosphohydrolase [Firmicutes bacterium]|uniref:nucleotide pyrophosphohydrolase n=1 Tax=Melghirimyces thermohalophilus TaxID=1236220 RepID=UPI000B89F312|nr:nucleotide pyrophosphohydrolase [Melghirimyces thermohalophilus]MDA8354508.1 nucleotide pyrophosphohydrolase [Bacillota bacterium]